MDDRTSEMLGARVDLLQRILSSRRHQPLAVMGNAPNESEKMCGKRNEVARRAYCELLHGIVQHDAYHAGQIAILKKVLAI